MKQALRWDFEKREFFFVFSYIVCPECHKKELEEEEKTNEKEKDD